MFKRRILGAIIVVLFVNIACGGLQPPVEGVSPEPAVNDSSPTPQTGRIEHTRNPEYSDSNGEVIFQDPINDALLAVALKDEQTSQPLAGIEVWFASNGREVLVITHDPTNQYPDAIRELRYSELSSESQFAGKMAAPSEAISLAAVLLLVKVVNLYQDFWKWKAFLEDFPDVEKWSKETLQLCVTPEQARAGPGLATDLLIGFVTKDLFGKLDVEKALEEIFAELSEEGTDNILDAYASTQTPSIMRFTVYSIGDGFPKFLSIEGYCLPPLDRWDAQSSLQWLLYGIQNKELYPFQHLADSEFSGYAYYIEGGQSVDSSTFLQDLDARLDTSQVSCDGYESSDGVIRVWTHGWSPAWVMTQYCYVDCEYLAPPYQSEYAGFFLYGGEGEWKLVVNYLNDPENYYFGPHDLISCNQPERLNISSSQIPDSQVSQSCPGAPPQRIWINEMGYVCTKNDAVFLRDDPSRSGNGIARLSPGTSFTVIGGPQCSDNWSWWEIRTDDGMTGWISEGGDNIDPYFICPYE